VVISRLPQVLVQTRASRLPGSGLVGAYECSRLTPHRARNVLKSPPVPEQEDQRLLGAWGTVTTILLTHPLVPGFGL